MERYRQIIEFVRKHLSTLKPVHKVLAGSAVVILVLGFFLVIQYSGKPDTVSVSVNVDQLDEAVSILKTRGIAVTPVGTELLVPAKDQQAAISALSENNALSPNATAMLLNMIKDAPWYANRHQNMQTYYAALQEVLSNVVGNMSFVKSAVVMISPPGDTASAPGSPAARMSASVTVYPANGKLERAQVQGIALIVAGPVQGLSPEDVKIVDGDTGLPLNANDDNSMGGGTYMEVKMQMDAYWESMIANSLSYIPGIRVAVNATPDVTQANTSDLSYKKEGSGTINPVINETSRSQTGGDQNAGAEPGAVPNTGQSVTTPAASGSAASKNQEETTSYQPKAGMTQTNIIDPRGFARKVNATVKIPRSYIVAIWEQRNPDSKTRPDDAALKPVETEEIKSITDSVRLLIDTQGNNTSTTGSAAGTASPMTGEVNVSTYIDYAASLAPTGSTGLGSTTFVGLPAKWLGASWQAVGMIALSLVSIFLMFKLVKSAASRSELPTTSELVGLPPTLSAGGDELVGQADESAHAIDALELDDDEIRARTLVDQVSEMVNANPEDSSRLLRRWIESEE